MLTIHNTTYAGINDPNLRRALGIHVNWIGTFFNYVHNMIYSAQGFRFPSMNAMIQNYLNVVTPNFGLFPLNINPAWMCYIQPLNHPMPQAVQVVIRMTGSRNGDEFRANNELFRRYGTLPPAGYTWHHVEGMWYRSGHFYCNMCLVDSTQHNTRRHYGAVNEYKWIYAVGYR